MALSFIRPAEEWTTGGAPMTRPQKGSLYFLGRERGVYIPFVDNARSDNTQNVTKAEASILISMFEDGVRPSDDFIESLGRDPTPYEPPQHPSEWLYPYARATNIQLDWLTRLISTLGVPRETMLHTLSWVTIGHASLLIKQLREYKNFMGLGIRREDSMALFEQAFADVKKELPFPEEESEATTSTYEGLVKLEMSGAVQSETWVI